MQTIFITGASFGMRKLFFFVFVLLGVFGIWSGNVAVAAQSGQEKILVAYFSRADENYGVGYITKGNTRIVAEMIAAKTGGCAVSCRLRGLQDRSQQGKSHECPPKPYKYGRKHGRLRRNLYRLSHLVRGCANARLYISRRL